MRLYAGNRRGAMVDRLGLKFGVTESAMIDGMENGHKGFLVYTAVPFWHMRELGAVNLNKKKPSFLSWDTAAAGYRLSQSTAPVFRKGWRDRCLAPKIRRTSQQHDPIDPISRAFGDTNSNIL